MQVFIPSNSKSRKNRQTHPNFCKISRPLFVDPLPCTNLFGPLVEVAFLLRFLLVGRVLPQQLRAGANHISFYLRIHPHQIIKDRNNALTISDNPGDVLLIEVAVYLHHLYHREVKPVTKHDGKDDSGQ